MVVVAAVAAAVVKLCGRGGGNGWRARWCGWRSGGRVGGRVCRWAAKVHGDTYSWVCEILEKCSAEKNVGDGRRQREEIRNIPVRPRASMHQRMVDNRCEPVGPRRGRGALSRHRRGARGGAMAPPYHGPSGLDEPNPARLFAVLQASFRLRKRRAANATGCARVGSITACVGENTAAMRRGNSRGAKSSAQRGAVLSGR